MNKNQDVPVSNVHAGNIVEFAHSSEFVVSNVCCESVESVFGIESVVFEFLDLFGGCVCVLGLTAEQVQGASVYGF